MFKYFKDIILGSFTIIKGMILTAKYFFKPPVTMEYPDEVWDMPEGYRGFHRYEVEKCIACLLCAKACPVNCIDLKFERHGKELKILKYTVDYQRCMFCNLCTDPCPKNCIHLDSTYQIVGTSREEMIVDYTKIDLKQFVKNP